MTNQGLVFDRLWAAGATDKTGPDSEKPDRKQDVSRMLFLDGNPQVEVSPEILTAHRVNYIRGNDASQWQTDIPTSLAVRYRELYPGIDLKIYGTEDHVEYDWVVRPSADNQAIRFEFRDAHGSLIDENGDLTVSTDAGDFVHKKPAAFQEVEGQRVPVEAHFSDLGENRYGFEVGSYDRSLELVIDPSVLVFSTYLGGSSGDRCHGIALDDSGSVYVTGYTSSTDFPTRRFFMTDPGDGNEDVFVTKLSSSGDSLEYSTYIGHDCQ